jgi:hypothetical protein
LIYCANATYPIEHTDLITRPCIQSF